jgi:predicted GNAT family N-acyltransferase
MPDLPSEPNVVVAVTDWSVDHETLSRIRRDVFCREQGIDERDEWDAGDALAVHVVARFGDEAVGTGRLLPDGKIGRMAVLAAYRNRGIGSALLARLLTVASTRGDPEVYLHAQRSAVRFYASHGFNTDGDPYLEAGIVHQTMRRSPRHRS